MTATALALPKSRPLGDSLERRRVQARADRVERVLVALRAREVFRASGGEVPIPLRAAIRDFADELAVLRSRLEQLVD